nr:PilC/PilY family type IV pilus protein [Halothiobacillus sp.]
LATGTVTYQSIYHTGKWTGDLKAFTVDPNTGAIAAAPTWSAGTNLSGLTTSTASTRNIHTYNPAGANANKQYVAFSDPTKLSSTEVTALGGSANAQSMINYLRGDPYYEQKNNGTYRNRDTALGDIVNSQPVYEGAPDPNRFNGPTFTGSSTYATFASNELSRSPTVFVAANDGMLHAFDAGTGTETFAYVPGAVITNGLSTLSNPNYGAVASAPHQFFNDGDLTIADAYYSSNWHSVLVGTTGRGPAKAIYAFDVTDPANIQFLWERSSGDGLANSSYIGQMTGKPIVAQTADGTWSVLMGNGYNSTNGSAALLQFDIQTGALTAYTTDASTSNGLAAPAVWLADPTDGLSTTAYAGDLLGRVWSFDLTAANTGHTGTHVFTATDSSGNAQPITAGLLAGKDPTTSNVWVFFGTGAYLNSGDLTNLQTQSWYGLIVQSATNSLVSNLLSGRSSALVQRSIVAEVAANSSATPPTLGARVFTPLPSPNGMAGKFGWYIDLTSPLNGAEGERMVTPNQFQGSLLIGTSRIPVATDVCNPSGRGWIMALDPFTGTNPSDLFFDVNGDGKFDSSDKITYNGKEYPAGGLGFSSIPNNPIFVGNTMLVSFDNGKTSSLNTAGSVGGLNRVSWREIVNQ